jgi:hypothetical protein
MSILWWLGVLSCLHVPGDHTGCKASTFERLPFEGIYLHTDWRIKGGGGESW